MWRFRCRSLGLAVLLTAWQSQTSAQTDTPGTVEQAPAEGNTTARTGPQRLRALIQRLDANGDGVIDPAEVPDAAKPAFERLLRRGDANQDGKLDHDELRALASRARGVAGAAAGERLRRLRAMDKDGAISREEFEGPAALFDRLDANRDGRLSRDELRPRGPNRQRPRGAGARAPGSQPRP